MKRIIVLMLIGLSVSTYSQSYFVVDDLRIKKSEIIEGANLFDYPISNFPYYVKNVSYITCNVNVGSMEPRADTIYVDSMSYQQKLTIYNVGYENDDRDTIVVTTIKQLGLIGGREAINMYRHGEVLQIQKYGTDFRVLNHYVPSLSEFVVDSLVSPDSNYVLQDSISFLYIRADDRNSLDDSIDVSALLPGKIVYFKRLDNSGIDVLLYTPTRQKFDGAEPLNIKTQNDCVGILRREDGSFTIVSYYSE